MSLAPAPIGFAHRGGAHHRRLQNTLPAFRRAVELGAGGIESDVALTADRVPVLIHPGLVTRLRRPVSRLTRSELPSWVPSLEDVYRECGPHLDVALDMAAPQAADAVVDMARRHGDPGRLWLTYWRQGVLAQWRQRYPDVRLVFPMLLVRGSRAAARARALRAGGVDALNVHHLACSPRLADAVHSAGLLVFAWGARGGGAADRSLRNGADGVFCDDIPGMVAALDRAAVARAALSAAR